MAATILIVDDDPAQRRYLTAALKPAGHRVEEAAGGNVALERLLGAAGAPVGLVLLDVNMPDLDGITVLKRLRAAGA